MLQDYVLPQLVKYKYYSILIFSREKKEYCIQGGMYSTALYRKMFRIL